MLPLVDDVRTWLNKSGYPLEMRIASALQAAGFSVVQSDYFEDPESGKWRETDVVSYSECRGESCRVIFSLIVECKSDTSKPWVLFTSADNYPRALTISRRATSEKGESILNVLSMRDEISRWPLFVVPDRPAYGIAVAHSNRDHDTAFGALYSVCKASLGLVRRLAAVDAENLIPFVWPVIVIAAPMLEAYLDGEGQLQVGEVGSGLIIWKNPVIRRHTLVHVFTADRFLAQAGELFASSQQFAAAAAAENDRHPR